LDLSNKRILQLLTNPSTKEKGFELLVKKYTQKIFFIVKKMVIIQNDTEDIVQNIFLKIWLNIDTFRNESDLFTWIYRITYNETINFLNKKNKRLFIPVDDYKILQLKTVENDAFFRGDSIEKKLQKALTQLPPKQKAIFEMKYFENMKHQEIAKILKISVGNAKSQYHNAIKKIKEYINIELPTDSD